MTYKNIEFSLADGIARITLNRPDKLNSFTEAMHGELADALDQVEAGQARVLVLTGNGRGFCAGQDLSERQPGNGDVDLGETVEKFYAPLVRRLRALPMPIVVGVNGVARSEEHTSELQSRENLVCRLLLEKKKKQP